MTIDSTWLAAFKEDTPEAFTKHSPMRPDVVFVDGQIKLMQGSQGDPVTWDDYIYKQFVRHLKKFFEQAKTVVLAFDNYAEVPRAKCMTQIKRRKAIPVIPFTEHCDLPCMVPDREHWSALISNRTFKARVIDLVILRLPGLLLMNHPDKVLIVDYIRPVKYQWVGDKVITRESLDHLAIMGEADVKFTRYADLYGKLLVDSIDGDSIPIALMHHEMCLERGVIPPVVSVYRMELNLDKGKPAADKDSKKRAKPDDASTTKKPRTYEYVNIPFLYRQLRDAVEQSTGRARTTPGLENYQIRMLISLIALTGTDFSRGLPQLSGKTVFGYLPDLWGLLSMVYDPASKSLATTEAADRLVAYIYYLKYQKHCATKQGLSKILAELQKSKLADSTKLSLPSTERIMCTIQNVNWILAYWTCEAYPDPIQPQYGFRLERGVPCYAEC